MNKLKATGFLLIALTTGLGAVIYAAGWMSQKGPGVTKVVVAAVDIKKDSKVTSAMFSIVNWPSASVPPGAVGSIAKIQGRPLKVALLRGEPVLESHFVPKPIGLSGAIADGKRAMTIKVNEVSGVAGFALPGMQVDVIVNMQRDQDHRNAGATRISRTVLERVPVLAAAQESSRDGGKARPATSVTLEVSLVDAEKLDLARSVGTLSLVLRNQGDQAAVKTAGVSKDELFDPAPAEPVAPVMQKQLNARKPVANTRCVEVIRRGVRFNQCFHQP
jgi:pilus assembly protein CpaB